jgi:hypothetical protein
MSVYGSEIGKEEARKGGDLFDEYAHTERRNQSVHRFAYCPLALHSRYYIEYNSVENKKGKKRYDPRPL